MRTLKVLHVSYGGLGSGGVASVIHSISESLSNYFEFHCIVFNTLGSSEGRFLNYGKLHRIRCYGKKGVSKLIDIILRPVRMTYGCYRICKEENIDIIHCHNGYEEAYFLLGAKLAGVKNRIAHSHNSNSPVALSFLRDVSNSIHRYLINQLATCKIGCSEQACEDFFQSKNTQVINNSIDLNKFKWNRIPHDGLCFINVGRYCYQKNQTFVLDVFNKILLQYPEAKLKLVGFGEDEILLHDKVTAMGIEKSVNFIDGESVDIPNVYAEADAMIFPSTYEGFGIVLLEAQSCGCFCFASDVVPDATNVGLMMKLPLSLSAEGWASVICDHIPRMKESNNGNLRVNMSSLDINVICQQYKAIYDK